MTGSKTKNKEIVGHLARADLDPNVGMFPVLYPSCCPRLILGWELSEVVIAPTSLYLFQTLEILQEANNKQIQVAAQNVYHEKPGAHTGEISVEQLKQDGINWTLLGHSERRQAGESNELVARKTKAALDGGLNVILCIGESADERRDGKTEEVNARQLQAVIDAGVKDWANVVIAYEPIWYAYIITPWTTVASKILISLRTIGLLESRPSELPLQKRPRVPMPRSESGLLVLVSMVTPLRIPVFFTEDP